MIAPARRQELFCFLGTRQTHLRRQSSRCFTCPRKSLRADTTRSHSGQGRTDGVSYLTAVLSGPGLRLHVLKLQERSAKLKSAAGMLSLIGSGGWLRSINRCMDFDLNIDFANSPNRNSGVFIRATRETRITKNHPRGGGGKLQTTMKTGTMRPEALNITLGGLPTQTLGQ
jgi:hypothetical protein